MSRARRQYKALAANTHLPPHLLRQAADETSFTERPPSRDARMRACTIADPGCDGDCTQHPSLPDLVRRGFEQPLARDPQRLALLRRLVLAPASDELAQVVEALRARPPRERAELLRHGASEELLAALLAYPEHPLVLDVCCQRAGRWPGVTGLLVAQPLTDLHVATLAHAVRRADAAPLQQLPFARACLALLRVEGGTSLSPERLAVLARRATRRVEQSLALAYLEGLAEDWTGTPAELVSFLETSETVLEW